MKETYIPGLDPKTGITTQETSFGSRDMLEILRDDFDKPLAVLFANGNTALGIPPLATIVVDMFVDNQGQYCEGEVLDVYALISNALVKIFTLAIDNDVIDTKLAQRVFAVAASEGIDTAVANVLLTFPYDDARVTAAGKINEDNSRFKNTEVNDPETGEPAFKVCPGFRTAQSIERQLIRAIKAIKKHSGESVLFDTTIPKTKSVGDACKAVIDHA